MKFEVTRTSYWSDSEKKEPCEGAILEEFPWHGDKTCKRWTIELNSIQDIFDLIDKTKQQEVVLSKQAIWTTLPYIEIYDDYRE